MATQIEIDRMRLKVTRLKELGYEFDFLARGQVGAIESYDPDTKVIQVPYDETDSNIIELLDKKLKEAEKKNKSLYQALIEIKQKN